MTRLFLLSVFLLAAALPATAKDRSVTVPANRTSGISSFHVYNYATCYSPGHIKSDVTRQGENGTVKVVYKRLKLPDDVRGRCAGLNAGALVITYTPNRGYRGKDSARVIFRYPRFEGDNRTKSSTLNLSITVK